ncbi:MAG TPA: hypothetical protein VFU53_08895 [Burkholderiales bacterium]|nr:hypothetical protein [Burkholderiales bacterium]
MWFFFSLIPATLPVVLGYFVLFSSTKSAGAVGAFGKILAVWLFILAAFFPIAGAYVSIAGISPLDTLMQRMESMHSGESSQN